MINVYNFCWYLVDIQKFFIFIKTNSCENEKQICIYKLQSKEKWEKRKSNPLSWSRTVNRKIFQSTVFRFVVSALFRILSQRKVLFPIWIFQCRPWKNHFTNFHSENVESAEMRAHRNSIFSWMKNIFAHFLFVFRLNGDLLCIFVLLKFFINQS